MEEGTPPAQQADLQDVELGESEEAPGSEITPLAPADVELGRQQQQPPPPPPPPRASAAGSAAGGDVRPLRDCDSVEKTEADAVAEREKWANKTAAAVGVDDDQDQHDQAQLLSAFLACDLDGSGEIGPAELRAILLAIGADVDLETTRQLVADAERQTVERNRQQAQLELTVHVGGLSTFKLVGEGGADSERAKAAYEKELTDLMAQFGAINSVHVRVREREDVVESVAIQKVSWGLVTYHKVSEVAAAIKGQAQIKKQKPEWTDLVVRPIDAKQVEASKGAMRQLKELQWTDPKRHFERTYGLAIQASTHAEAPAGRLRQAVRRVAAVGGAAEAAGGDDELEGQLDFGEFEQLMSGPLLEKLLIGSGSGADTQGDEQSQKDLALLNELLLSECAEALREAGLLGRLKDVTWAELEEAGIERESAHQLLKFASLSVGQRGRERVGRIRALRQAFDTADVDDDDAVDRDELETVIVALNPRPISPAEVDLLWNMLKPDDDGKQYLLRSIPVIIQRNIQFCQGRA
jgi:Ca2+-binding EF-hand superfamily protein